MKSEYVYVASSWRNPIQPVVIQLLKDANIPCYDFRNPEGNTGFSWEQVGGRPPLPAMANPRLAWENMEDYLSMVNHPRAVEGFTADFNAMDKADTFILLLPCGKSAHLELGWAVGAGKYTAILLEDPVEPELMYKMVDYLATSVLNLLEWLECEKI